MNKFSERMGLVPLAVSCLVLAACGSSDSDVPDTLPGKNLDVVIGEPEEPEQPEEPGDDTYNEELVNVSNDDPDLFVQANIVADFEDIDAIQASGSGWTLTGVFADVDDWTGVTSSIEGAARVGSAAVSTCEIGGNDCDSNVGSILTPPFTVTSDYLNFLMTGGATAVGAEIRLAGTDTVLAAFQPNSCGRATITDNDDWFHFDISALRGEEVQLYLFDNEEGGCGFISFDHFYQSGMAIGAVGDVAEVPLEPFNVTLPEDASANVISRFDNAVKMTTSVEENGEGWSATGDFEAPTSVDAWQGNSANLNAARIGDRGFSSCATGDTACEAQTGTITSAAFAINSDYIRFLAAGGSADNQEVSINLLRAGTNEVLASFTPETCDPTYMNGDDDWYHMDVSAIQGQNVRLEIVDNSTEACGFISIDHAYQTSALSFEDDDGVEVIPDVGGVADIPAEFKSYNVDVAADAFEEGAVVANFDEPQAMLDAGWTASGDFASPASETAWAGTTVVDASARVGIQAVSTCELNDNAAGCDAPVGALTSPLTTIIDPYLYFLMAGGNGEVPVGLRVLDSIGNELINYSPATCGPSHIDGNDDWTFIDQSMIHGAKVYYQLYDEESGGCGFVSFDHLYQTDRDPASTDGVLPADMINAGAIILDDTQMQSIGFNSSLPYADSNETVIGRFDDAEAELAAGWVATGDFANPADGQAWQGTTRDEVDVAAHIGVGAVSTCELNNNASGCDAPTGTLTSPTFTVSADKPILAFMMKGGNGTAPVGLRVLSATDDSELENHISNSCGPSHIDGDDDWVEIDLSAYAGDDVKVEIYDNEPGGCGFVSFDHVHMTSGTVYTP